MKPSIKKIALIGGRSMGKTTLLTRLLKYTEVELKDNMSLSIDNPGTRKVLAIKNALLKDGKGISATRFEDIVDLSYCIVNKNGVKWIIDFKDYPGELFEKFLDYETIKSGRIDKISADAIKKFLKYLNGCDAAIVLLPAEIIHEYGNNENIKGNLEIYRGVISNCLDAINKKYGIKIPVALAISKWDRCSGTNFDSYIKNYPYCDFESVLGKTAGDKFLKFPISSFGKDFQEGNPDSIGTPYNVLEMLIALCEKSDETILQKAKSILKVRKFIFPNLRTIIIESLLKKKVSEPSVIDKISDIIKPYEKKALVNLGYYSSVILILAFAACLFQQNKTKSELIRILEEKNNQTLEGHFAKQKDFCDFKKNVIDRRLYNFSNYGIQGMPILDCYTPVINKFKDYERKFIQRNTDSLLKELQKLEDNPKYEYKDRLSIANERESIINKYIESEIFIDDSYFTNDGKRNLKEQINEIKKFKDYLAKYDPWEKAFMNLPGKDSDKYLRSLCEFFSTHDGSGKRYDDEEEYKDKKSEIDLLKAKFHEDLNQTINKAKLCINSIEDIYSEDKIKYDHRVDKLKKSKEELQKILKKLPTDSRTYEKDLDGRAYEKDLKTFEDSLKTLEGKLTNLEENKDFYKDYEALEQNDRIKINEFLQKYEAKYTSKDEVFKFLIELNDKKYKYWQEEYTKLCKSENSQYAHSYDIFITDFPLREYDLKDREYKSIKQRLTKVEETFKNEMIKGMPQFDENAKFKDKEKFLINKREYILKYKSKFSAEGWKNIREKEILDLSQRIKDLGKYVKIEKDYDYIKTNIGNKKILIFIDDFLHKYKNEEYPKAISYIEYVQENEKSLKSKIKEEISSIIDLSNIPDITACEEVISYVKTKKMKCENLLKRLPASYKNERNELNRIITSLDFELKVANLLKINKEKHHGDNVLLLNELLSLPNTDRPRFDGRFNDLIQGTRQAVESEIYSKLNGKGVPSEELDNLETRATIYREYIYKIRGPEDFRKGLTSKYNDIKAKIGTIRRKQDFDNALKDYNSKIHMTKDIKIKKIEDIIRKFSDFELVKSEITSLKQELERIKVSAERDKIKIEADKILKSAPADRSKAVLKKYRSELSKCKEKAEAYKMDELISILESKIDSIDILIGSVTIEDIEKAFVEYKNDSNSDNNTLLKDKIESFDVNKNKSELDVFEKLNKEYNEYKKTKENLIKTYSDFCSNKDKRSFDDFYRASNNNDLLGDKECKTYLDWARSVKEFIEYKKVMSVKLINIDFSRGNFKSSEIYKNFMSPVELQLEVNDISLLKDEELDSETFEGYKAIGNVSALDTINVKYQNTRGHNSKVASNSVSIYKLIVAAKQSGNCRHTFEDNSVEGNPSITLEFSGFPTYGGDL